LAVVTRAGDDRGGVTTLATARTLPADAAVGLLSRERSTFRGCELGATGGGGALRDLASEAAVGANRPDEGREGGREGREEVAAFFKDGVLGREPGVAAAVGDFAVILAAVERGSVDGALRVIPVPFDGVRGVGVLERVARAAVVVGGRVPGDDVDFEGDAGVLADLGGAVYGRDVEGADTRDLIGCAAVGAGTGAGAGAGAGASASAGASCTMMDPLPSTVNGVVLGAAGDCDLGANDAGSRSGGAAPSSDAVAVGTNSVVIEEPRRVAAEVGGL
jgi:hypothetical protein